MRLLILLILSAFCFVVFSQQLSSDIKSQREAWGRESWREANTARYAFYMRRQQRLTILYMNLARQDGKKFNELIATTKKPLPVRNLEPLKPSFQLWLPAATHALYSGMIGHTGHALFDIRTKIYLNFNSPLGENCSYGYRKAEDIVVQLLNSPPHRGNILEKDFIRTAVAKNLHIGYLWNSVTVFSGPKWFDILFDHHAIERYLQLDYGFQAGEKLFSGDVSVGILGHNNIQASLLKTGFEFYKNQDWIIAPKLSFANVFYSFYAGLDALYYISQSGHAIVIRPTAGLFIPIHLYFHHGIMEMSMMDYEKKGGGIKLTAGYNFTVNNNNSLAITPLQFGLAFVSDLKKMK